MFGRKPFFFATPPGSRRRGRVRAARAVLGGLAVLSLVALPALSPALTIEEEKRLGKTFYDKLDRDNLLLHHEQAESYLRRVGDKILAQCETTLFPYRFSLVRSPAINAFATPGGYVYVNSGLVGLVEKESHLAGVLAHEIAHVQERHIADTLARSQKLSIATLAAILAGAFLGGGTDASAAITGFSMAAASTLSLKYSREQEEAADRLGMALLTGAGYEGPSMLEFLRIMKRYEFYSNNMPSYFLTHPGTEDRIRYLDGLLETGSKTEGAGELVGPFRRIQTLLRLHEGNTDANRRLFQAELEADPASADALFGLAVTEERAGHTEQAIALFQRGLSQAPGDGDLLRELGMTYFRLGRYGEARDALRRALQVDPRNEQALVTLGRTHEALGDLASALSAYKGAEDLAAGDPDVLYRLAMAYGKQGKRGESHYYFGRYFKNKGKPTTARFHFRAALELVPADQPRHRDIVREMESLSSQEDREAEEKRRNPPP